MMTMQNARLATWNRLRTGIVIGAAFALGACTEADMSFENILAPQPDRVPESASVPQDVHPILVEAQRHIVNLPGRDGADQLSPSEIRRVDEIVAAFMADARGMLVISVPGAAATDARVLGRAKQISDRAKRHGLASSRILLRVDTEDQNADSPLSVGFETLVVIAPECGDWSKESSHDFWNVDYSDFGCATQHNIAVMIAEPADLLSMRAADPADAARLNRIIQAYRAGLSTGAARAAVEQATSLSTD